MHSVKVISGFVLSAALFAAHAQAPAAGAGGATSGAAGATTGGGGGAAGGGGTAGRTTSPFPTTQQQQTQPNFDQNQNRPIFLSGKVRMQDGAAPPESVTIERICASRGSPIPEAYSDSKGNFSFQVGQRTGVLPDASVSSGDNSPFGSGGSSISGANGRAGGGGVSERDLMSCDIRASLPGYRSTVVSLAGRRSLDNPDVGTIILRRLADVTGFTTSATTLMAPKDAKKAMEKAVNALKKNKVPDAQRELETAVNLHPKFAEAWFELGRIQSMQKDGDQARQSYAKAIEADDKFVKPYLGLALIEAQQQKWVEVKQLTDKVIKLNRYDFPSAFFYGAVANFNLRQVDEAEKLCRAGLEIDQFHSMPKMSHLLGMMLADKQDFKGASEHLNAYLKFAPKAPDSDQVRKQIAEIDGKVAEAKP